MFWAARVRKLFAVVCLVVCLLSFYVSELVLLIYADITIDNIRCSQLNGVQIIRCVVA